MWRRGGTRAGRENPQEPGSLESSKGRRELPIAQMQTVPNTQNLGMETHLTCVYRSWVHDTGQGEWVVRAVLKELR